MLSWLETAFTWVIRHVPNIIRVFGSSADSRAIREWTQGSQIHLKSGGAAALLSVVVSRSASTVRAVRAHRALHFSRVVGIGCAMLALLYVGVWWIGTAGYLRDAQSTLPWRAYRQSIESARATLATKTIASNNAEGHLATFVERSNRFSEVIFTTVFIFFVSTLMWAALRVSLRLAQLLLNDLTGVTAFSPFFLTMVGAFTLRLVIESSTLGLMTLAEMPSTVITLLPLVKIGAHAPGTIGVVTTAMVVCFSGLSWFIQPQLVIWVIHLLTTPLRLVSYITAMCATVAAMKKPAVRGICFVLSWVEKQFSER